MHQRWVDVSFLHWRVEPAAVAALLPPGVDPDVFDGSAWVSLVGFEMRDLRLRGLPKVPTTHRFPEFNVRTYVTGSRGPGVWFASLDVPSVLPVAAARVGFSLPYCVAGVERSEDDGRVAWSVERRWPTRAHGGFTVDLGDGIEEPDELDDWLTARWALYAATRSGRVVWAPVHHEPWSLRAATAVSVDGGLAAVAGCAVSDPPDRGHHADMVTVAVGRPRLLPPVVEPPLVVHFDRDCGVCDAGVRWLRTRTDQGVSFRPSADLPADSPLRAHVAAALVADDGRRIHVGVDAVAAALARARRPWRWCAEALLAPGVHSVAGIVYRWVARNRQRISRRFGLTACRID